MTIFTLEYKSLSLCSFYGIIRVLMSFRYFKKNKTKECDLSTYFGGDEILIYGIRILIFGFSNIKTVICQWILQKYLKSICYKQYLKDNSLKFIIYNFFSHS